MFHINGEIGHNFFFGECNQPQEFLIRQYLFLQEVPTTFNMLYLISQIPLMQLHF